MDRPNAVIFGRLANAGLLEDQAEALVVYLAGPHAGHVARVCSAKFNCGAYEQAVRCECGVAWESEMKGCRQHHHQRPESGDLTLALTGGVSWGWDQWKVQGLLLVLRRFVKGRLPFQTLRRIVKALEEEADDLEN